MLPPRVFFTANDVEEEGGVLETWTVAELVWRRGQPATGEKDYLKKKFEQKYKNSKQKREKKRFKRKRRWREREYEEGGMSYGCLLEGGTF
jgi:hypothetical protein